VRVRKRATGMGKCRDSERYKGGGAVRHEHTDIHEQKPHLGVAQRAACVEPHDRGQTKRKKESYSPPRPPHPTPAGCALGQRNDRKAVDKTFLGPFFTPHTTT
jgi:hypothetical protein